MGCTSTAAPGPHASAGERVAVNLAGVDVADVARGSVLATPGALAVTRRADVHLTMLPGASLKHGARVRVHQGTAEVLARVAVAGAGGLIEPGGSADVRLRFEAPAVLARRDRLIVRSYSPLVTIGGGVVLDPRPPRPGVRTARGVARMASLAVIDDPTADRASALEVLVASAGAAGASVPDLVQRLGATRHEVAAAITGLSTTGRAVRGGDWVVPAAALERPIAAMLAGLADFHRAEPLAPGLSLEDARSRWFRVVPPPVVEAVVANLVASGRIVATDTLALTSHRVALAPEDQATVDWLDRRFREAGLGPPDVAALAGEARRPAATVEKLLQLLLKAKQLVRVDGLVFHGETLAALKDEIRALKGTAPEGRASVDVKTFKDTYQVSRKYAIPLLEYLDRERVTRRTGDVRIVL